jgi:hypothetical protein
MRASKVIKTVRAEGKLALNIFDEINLVFG